MLCDTQRRHMRDADETLAHTQKWVVMTADNEQLTDTATKAFLPVGPKCPVPHRRSWPQWPFQQSNSISCCHLPWVITLTNSIHGAGWIECVCMCVMCICHRYTICEWTWASYSVFLTGSILCRCNENCITNNVWQKQALFTFSHRCSNVYVYMCKVYIYINIYACLIMLDYW